MASPTTSFRTSRLAPAARLPPAEGRPDEDPSHHPGRPAPGDRAARPRRGPGAAAAAGTGAVPVPLRPLRRPARNEGHVLPGPSGGAHIRRTRRGRPAPRLHLPRPAVRLRRSARVGDLSDAGGARHAVPAAARRPRRLSGPDRADGGGPAQRRGRIAGDEGDLPGGPGQGRARRDAAGGARGGRRAAEPRPARRSPRPRPADAGGALRRPGAAAGGAYVRLGPRHDPHAGRQGPGAAARRAVSAVGRLRLLRPDSRPPASDGRVLPRRRRPRPARRHRPGRQAARPRPRRHDRRIHRRGRPAPRGLFQRGLPLLAALRRDAQ